MALTRDWVPRGENHEADDLINMKLEGFSAKRRIVVEGKNLSGRVLPELMASSQELYEQLAEEHSRGRRRGAEAAQTGGGRASKRRELDPW